VPGLFFLSAPFPTFPPSGGKVLKVAALKGGGQRGAFRLQPSLSLSRSTILKTPLPVPAMSPTGAALRQGAWRRDGRGGGFSLRSDLRGYDFLQGCKNMLSLMLIMHRSCVVTAARSGGAESPPVGELFDRSSGHGEGRAPAARSSLCDPAGGGNFPAAFAIDLLERKGMTVCSERFGNCSTPTNGS
jgi:hypothetical protein